MVFEFADAKIFYRLETWKPDSDHHDGSSSTSLSNPSGGGSSVVPLPSSGASTSYLRKISAFHRFNVIAAYRVAGGSEERANALLGNNSASTTGGGGGGGQNNPLSNNRTRRDVELPVDYQRKVQSAFLDGLYAFLDGLVHVAFSDPDQVFFSGGGGGGGGGVRRENVGLIEGSEEETGRG